MTDKSVTKRRGPGRPPHDANEDRRLLVRTLAGYGITHEQIAKHLRTDRETLTIHYRDELDQGKIEANIKVATKLFEKAMAGEGWAICFYLKAQAKWSERISVEHTGDFQITVICPTEGNPGDLIDVTKAGSVCPR
jgi:hypothetical protein